MRAVSFIKNRSLLLNGSQFVNFSRFTFADRIKDKEVAEERFYFDKEERKLAEKLLSKLKQESKKEAVDDTTYKQKERLRTIFDSHKEQLPPALMEDLIKWKNEDKH